MQAEQLYGLHKAMSRSSPSRAKRRTGRPATGHNPNFTVRLPKHLVATIDKIAREQSTTRAEVMRQLMTEALEARKAKS